MDSRSQWEQRLEYLQKRNQYDFYTQAALRVCRQKLAGLDHAGEQMSEVNWDALAFLVKNGGRSEHKEIRAAGFSYLDMAILADHGLARVISQGEREYTYTNMGRRIIEQAN